MKRKIITVLCSILILQAITVVYAKEHSREFLEGTEAYQFCGLNIKIPDTWEISELTDTKGIFFHEYGDVQMAISISVSEFTPMSSAFTKLFLKSLIPSYSYQTDIFEFEIDGHASYFVEYDMVNNDKTADMSILFILTDDVYYMIGFVVPTIGGNGIDYDSDFTRIMDSISFCILESENTNEMYAELNGTYSSATSPGKYLYLNNGYAIVSNNPINTATKYHFKLKEFTYTNGRTAIGVYEIDNPLEMPYVIELNFPDKQSLLFSAYAEGEGDSSWSGIYRYSNSNYPKATN